MCTLYFEFNSFPQVYTGICVFTYTPVIKYKLNTSDLHFNQDCLFPTKRLYT